MRAWLTSVAVVSLCACPLPPASDGGVDAGGGTADGGGGGVDGGTDAGSDGGFADLDVIAVRFNADGTLDDTFGSGGVARLDLGAATATSNRDSAWSAALGQGDQIIVFSATRGTGTRTDTDRVVSRLSANGALDTTFGQQGHARLDLGGAVDSARHGLVQPDGKIVAAGYAATPTGVGTQVSNRPVLLRLTSDGVPDPTFGDGGVVATPFFVPSDGGPWGLSEAYAVALDNGRYVTAGYGRAGPSGTVDLLAMRYTNTGAVDTTFHGGTPLALDLVGNDDRGRNLVLLPDGRAAIVGSGSPSTSQLDALVALVNPDGTLDTSFGGGAGYRLFSFSRPDEAFFGVALNPGGSQLAAVGYRAGGGEDDDATLLLLPTGSGGPAEAAQAVELSPSANDRFFAVTYDGTGRPVAVGYVREGGDTRIAVVRFTANGQRDSSFGAQGLAVRNIIASGADETARAVVVQSTGKIVVVGVAERP